MSVRLAPVYLKLAHFTWENKSKTLLLLKNNIKNGNEHKKFTKECFFEAKMVNLEHFVKSMGYSNLEGGCLSSV